MAQNGFQSFVARLLGSSSGPNQPLNVDGEGNLLVSSGGNSSALQVTAAAVIKATPGRLAKITVVAPGTTSGALTVNDCATTGAASAANQIVSIPFGSLTAGQVIALDWPCQVGIVVSAVPGGGSPQYSISFD
jgi:hypothetical protein